uniref:Uncharacterized protein n=1 Tax=Siphoviridae sp. ctGyV19 TaxID=2826225 RepID=A0A8S5MUU5_9CAUD|nr:MAG TPA: hypothetical protein [Siphoviridae sp. ctGyV19]
MSTTSFSKPSPSKNFLCIPAPFSIRFLRGRSHWSRSFTTSDGRF